MRPIPRKFLNTSVTYIVTSETDKWNNSTETEHTLSSVAVINVKSKSRSDMDGINTGSVYLIYDTKNSSGKSFDFKKGDKVIYQDNELEVLSVLDAKIGNNTHHWELELS